MCRKIYSSYPSVVIRVEHIVGQVDEQLGQASFGCGVVAEDGGEGCVAEGLGEALAKGFARAGIVAEPVG